MWSNKHTKWEDPFLRMIFLDLWKQIITTGDKTCLSLWGQSELGRHSWNSVSLCVSALSGPWSDTVYAAGRFITGIHYAVVQLYCTPACQLLIQPFCALKNSWYLQSYSKSKYIALRNFNTFQYISNNTNLSNNIKAWRVVRVVPAACYCCYDNHYCCWHSCHFD